MRQPPSKNVKASGPTVLEIAQKQRELRGEAPLVEMPRTDLLCEYHGKPNCKVCGLVERSKKQVKKDIEEDNVSQYFEMIAPTRKKEIKPSLWSEALFNDFLRPIRSCVLCESTWSDDQEHTLGMCSDKGYLNLQMKLGNQVVDMLSDIKLTHFHENGWYDTGVESGTNELGERLWYFIVTPPLFQDRLNYPEGFKVSCVFERSENTLIENGKPIGEKGSVRLVLEAEDLNKKRVLFSFAGDDIGTLWMPVFDQTEIISRIREFWIKAATRLVEYVFRYNSARS